MKPAMLSRNDALPDKPYPSHLDIAWVAVDRKGQIGVFTTGGAGPIPKIYLREAAALDLVTSAVESLGVTCGYDLVSTVPRPDDFVAFAQRGLFSFDWSDVHRTRKLVGAYELQARPRTPVTVQMVPWPPAVLGLLKNVTSDALDLDWAMIDVRAALDCATVAV